MNCGIYHPFSEERFDAYKTGINKLVSKSLAVGAEVILLTPPPYAGASSQRTPPTEGQAFSYKHPTPEYNKALAAYAAWIMEYAREHSIHCINIRPPLERYMEQSYSLDDPIHPKPFGHELIAEQFLKDMGCSTGSPLLDNGENNRSTIQNWDAILKRVNQQRITYDLALLNDIGHGNPNVLNRETLPLPEAEKRAEAIGIEIRAIIETARQKNAPRRK
jgi:hypothetical protein